ncbi:MAG TPA: hypothetical protein PKI11_03025 [Candidatus Hydrogenedentes bacterium]|nr:hypothetical protein [Candidatus Hydrogenedentota bacterium]HNT88679.1 hypothetical protein [Candidatus Hydrogenedentota bacterium]
MKVVAVTPIDVRSPRHNLVPNGDFKTWWAGAATPEEFQPPDPRSSRLARMVGLSGSNFAARQVWNEGDAAATPDRHFSAEVVLEPDTAYALSVTAELRAGRGVSVGVRELGADGAPAAEDAARITLLPSEGVCKRYERTFTPARGGRALVLSRAESAADVVWYDWRLAEGK